MRDRAGDCGERSDCLDAVDPLQVIPQRLRLEDRQLDDVIAQGVEIFRGTRSVLCGHRSPPINSEGQDLGGRTNQLRSWTIGWDAPTQSLSLSLFYLSLEPRSNGHPVIVSSSCHLGRL